MCNFKCILLPVVNDVDGDPILKIKRVWGSPQFYILVGPQDLRVPMQNITASVLSFAHCPHQTSQSRTNPSRGRLEPGSPSALEIDDQRRFGQNKGITNHIFTPIWVILFANNLQN